MVTGVFILQIRQTELINYSLNMQCKAQEESSEEPKSLGIIYIQK